MVYTLEVARATMPDYCAACRKVFPDEDTRVAHEESMHPYVCTRCERRFDTEALFKEHMKLRHPFACRWCNEQGSDVDDLALHVYHSHTYVCEVCDNAAFKHKEQCMEHEWRMHPQCKECSKVFLNAVVLQRHTEILHPKCQWCKLPFKTLNALQQHMKMTHVMCSTCSKMCESRVTLQAHVEKRHPSCEMCRAAFSSREELATHKEVAHPACGSCGIQFSSARSLATHAKEKHVDFAPPVSTHHIPHANSVSVIPTAGRRASISQDTSTTSESKIEESIRAASAYHISLPPDVSTSASTNASNRHLMSHLETLEHSGHATDDKIIASVRPRSGVLTPPAAQHTDKAPTPRAVAHQVPSRRTSVTQTPDVLDEKILESIRAASAYTLPLPASTHHLGPSNHASAFQMSSHAVSSSMHVVDERIQESMLAAASAVQHKSSPPQNHRSPLTTSGMSIVAPNNNEDGSEACAATGIRGGVGAIAPSPVDVTRRLPARRRSSVQSQSSDEPPTPRVWPVGAQPQDIDIEYVSAAGKKFHTHPSSYGFQATTNSSVHHNNASANHNNASAQHRVEASESALHVPSTAVTQPRSHTVDSSTYEMPLIITSDGGGSSSSNSRHSSLSPHGSKSSMREGPPRAPDLHARFAPQSVPFQRPATASMHSVHMGTHPPMHDHGLGPGYQQAAPSFRPVRPHQGHVCPFCVAWLRDLEAREAHMLDCHALCRVCDSEYNTLTELTAHTREAHPTCRVCHHQCGSVEDLVRHTDACHPTD